MYKDSDDAILRLADGARIPKFQGNRDYDEYLEWVAAGNTPEPADPPPIVYPRFVVRDFLALFTQQEKLAVKAATRVSDEVALWYDEMLAAQYITVEDPATVAGLDALATAGLLSVERHDEIIAAMQPT